MMYSEKVVVAIKVNGRVLREDGDTVSLPFGSEYSILVKNLESVRSQIAVSVDGDDAVGQIVIPAHSHVELERFIRNGNLDGGNRFKFIERTQGIEKHRGIGVEDGLIRVESWKERVQRYVDIPVPRYYDQPIRRPPMPPRWGGPMMARSGRRPLHPTARAASATSRPDSRASALGITVPGSESHQRFHTVGDFLLEPQTVVIVLRLRGIVGDIPISEPVTVNIKPVCITCGRTNKGTSLFCSACGTALAIL